MFRKILKYSGIFLIILGLLLAVAMYLVNDYLESNKTKILDDLAFLHEGSISFDEASLSIYEHFPNATLTLNNVLLKDSLSDERQLPFLHVKKVHTLLTINDLWSRKLSLRTLILADGVLNLNTDKFGYNNLKHLLLNKQKNVKKGKKPKFWKDIQVKSEALELIVQRVKVGLSNALKNTRINGQINELSTTLNLEAKDLAGKIQMDLSMDSLSFNPKNGAFLPNSRLKGILDFAWQDSLLTIQPFDMGINEETFNFAGHFYTRGSGVSSMTFENQQTRLHKVLPLLPKQVAKSLTPYKINTTFYAKTQILTSFKPNTRPEIIVDFKLANQSVTVHDIPFKQTSLNGQFVNRTYTDERKHKEGKKRFRLALNAVNAQQGQFTIQSEEIQVKATPETGPVINMETQISGAATGISDWLENDQFLFEKGQFKLSANINGALNDLDNILIESDASLDLHDFSVVYQPANVTFPFEQMKLKKERDDAFFTIVNSSFVDEQDLLLDGFLKHFPALLVAYSQQQVESQAIITGKKLAWTDFLNFFEANGLEKNEKSKTLKQKKQSMKASVRGLYHNFHPKIQVKFDTLAYYDLLRLDSFESGLYFKDDKTVILEKTSFKYDGGTVAFNGRLDISGDHQTPFEFVLETENLNLKKSLPSLNYLNIKLLSELDNLPENLNLTIKHEGVLDDEKGLIANSSTGEVVFDVNDGKDFSGKITYQPDTSLTEKDGLVSTFGKSHISLNGNPKVFNDFFKTEEFFFKDGHFRVDLDYAGNLESTKDLFTKGNAKFTLINSQVFYKPVGVTFPLTEIDLSLKNDQANFDFYLQTDTLNEKIHLNGNIENISELIIGETGKALKTTVDINSSKITWSYFLDLFASKEASEKEGKSESIKATAKGILKTFDPHLHLDVDTFIYSDKLVFQHMETGLRLRDSATLVVEKTSFDWHEGHIFLNASFDLGQKLITPFDANIETQNLDLNEVVESLDYLSLPSLRKLKKLDGKVTMNFDLSGTIDDNANRLLPFATEGRLAFDLQEVVVIGLEPLDAIAARLKMEKRFQELRFAPIVGEVSINGQEVEFPRLEIQSNAIHLFMEGTLSYGDLTNIWVSIPIHNLRRTNRYVIPEKTGYANAKRKVYIEVTSDEKGENQFKFRLFKRKFYKDRGILEQYKIDKKQNHAIRKALRKNKKVELTKAF